MYRNLNRVYARGRILGTAKVGVPAETLPSTGEHGPGYLYRCVNLPADNGKLLRGRVTRWPTTGALTVYEDTGFVFVPVHDGIESFDVQMEVDGATFGSAITIPLLSGVVTTTISCTVGNAVAAGKTADVLRNAIISCTVGNAVAAGLQVGVSNAGHIFCSVGNAVAGGKTATVTQETVISCTIGGAVAEGLQAGVHQGVIIHTTVGDAIADGKTAEVATSGETRISTTVGNAIAAGMDATVTVTAAPPGGCQLSQENIDAIANAVWAHAETDTLLTVARFLGLK